jgi:hypothetical protein
VLGETKSGKVVCFFLGCFFFFVFFFPRPAATGEKKGASKGDGTKIQMKIGYYVRPNFSSRRGGLGETKSGKSFVFFFFVFFFPQPAAAGGKKRCFERR